MTLWAEQDNSVGHEADPFYVVLSKFFMPIGYFRAYRLPFSCHDPRWKLVKPEDESLRCTTEWNWRCPDCGNLIFEEQNCCPKCGLGILMEPKTPDYNKFDYERDRNSYDRWAEFGRKTLK